MKNKEPVSEEEFMEAFQRLPEYLREYFSILKSHASGKSIIFFCPPVPLVSSPDNPHQTYYKGSYA
jgi:hypothetical protein